jgi:hypothetical protein
MSLPVAQTVPLLFMAGGEVLESEPYECGWAREALLIAYPRGGGVARLQVQVAADGERWIDLDEALLVKGNGACRALPSFGAWLRLRAEWQQSPPGAELDAYLILKS